MDEYSTSMDFSDLANEEALDAGKGDGAAGGYGKANYEASGGKGANEVLRLDATARARRFFVRRRDLLREHRLQPRDLRRIDPSIDFTKTSPSITIKEDVLLLNLGGVRAIVTAEKALLFEPNSATTRKFLEVVAPRLQTHGAARQQAASRGDPAAYVNVSHADYMARFYHQMLEELMDDEDELRELNLSSRPRREDRRRQRERNRLERERVNGHYVYTPPQPQQHTPPERLRELRTKYDRDRLRELRARFGWSEAERMLAGARDLEESIGVSLSARRYEVNRLELMLSIGSFAAAIGAMLAGIFGMNMRSNLEHSMLSFWGISGAIVLGCAWIFFAVMRYTRSKRIL
eukprot:XP_001703504.1 Mg2+ transporter protein, CorA-like protein [Chlamydomonas reinhardtii]